MAHCTTQLEIAHGAWAGAMAGWPRDIGAVVKEAWEALEKKHKLKVDVEVSVALIADRAMQALNRQHRKKNKPTNVLSFPMYEGIDAIKEAVEPPPLMLGDISMAYETLVKEADEQGKSLYAHTAHMLVHGVLHLAGYDHEDDADAEAMEAFETEILSTLSIDNPYEAVT
ncbi:rRNA maturation RNase YbeY [bacterium]|nr:rRNA maturation RNase YbeY [bacterium]